VKIDIAKKAVGDIVSSINPGMELGLIAYCHRKKGDCADIELLVPPQPNSAAVILQAVSKLEPKGKTLLTAAVIQAAQYLKFEEARASVILVSDGVETCEKDPCMAAEELERLGIDFTCHVIGFELKPGESSGLECLAKKTGGMCLAAKDAVSLKSSLEIAMKQVAKPMTTLIIEAKKSSGGELIDGLSFQVFADGAGENASANGTGGRWSTELPKAGKYTISAKLGGKSLELDASLKEGETVTKEVVFAKTGLKAVAFDKEGGVAFEKTLWDLYGPADAEGNRTKIAYSYDARPFPKLRLAPTYSPPHAASPRPAWRSLSKKVCRRRCGSSSAVAISSSAPSPPKASPPSRKTFSGSSTHRQMPRVSAKSSVTAMMRSPRSACLRASSPSKPKWVMPKVPPPSRSQQARRLKRPSSLAQDG